MKSIKVVHTSEMDSGCSLPAAAAPIDRLSALLQRFRVRARLFHNGALCGRIRYEALPGRAFLHVLRRGVLTVHHGKAPGVPSSIELREPAVLLYARPLCHEFVHPGAAESDFSCAALEFDGAERNPIVRALPPLVCVPLARVDGMRAALELLFDETDRPRCGSRVLADRLFEVAFILLLRWILDHPLEAGITDGMIAGLSDVRLARAIVAMHGEPAQAWTLAALAAEAGMSRSTFAEAFRRATGATPGRYLTDWRLSLTASMLRDGRPLKLIADEVGFAGAASLSKAFRQRYGIGPRDWIGSERSARQPTTAPLIAALPSR